MRSRPGPAVRPLVEAELIVHILLRMWDFMDVCEWGVEMWLIKRARMGRQQRKRLER